MSWKQGNVQSIIRSVPDNPSGIRPTEFRVLVLPDKVEEKTKGGIIIPDEKKDRDQYAVMEATIIECSPLAFTYESNWPEGSKPKAGDRVVIAKYAGGIIKGKDSVEYKLVADKDVLAVLE
jgi:chaperonin GroES